MSSEGKKQTLTTIRAEGGLRFSASVRGHSVIMDQPAAGGGADTAATPLELLGAALGGCVALYVHQFCAARGIDDEDMRVEVVAESADAPKRIGRFIIRLALPASMPSEYRAAVERVARTCPVHSTLTHAPAIDLEVTAPAADAVQV
jgi:putative redox protein